MMPMRDILDLRNSCLGFAMSDDGSEFPAVLCDTGDQLKLSILKHDDGQVLERFVTAVKGEEQDPGMEKKLGECIEFKAGYTYTLIGREGSSYGASSGVGVITIIPEYAVAGVACKDFGTIDGMLTSMDGLSQWLGLSCFRWGSEGLKQTLTVEDTPETAIGLSDGLGYVQKWFIRSHPDSVDLENRVWLKTFLPQTSWPEHLRVHDLISELMSIADCRTHGYRDMKVYKATSDIGFSEEIDWNEWHDVLSYNPVVDRNAHDCETKYLFCYEDLPKGSIAKWRKLRDSCAQGVIILLYLIREFDNIAIETKAVLTGIMLEYIGEYIECSKILDEDTRCDEGSDDKPETGFRRLMTLLLKCFGGSVPLVDSLEWKDCMRRAYMGNKHPDAKKATLDEMYLAVMESMLLVRMWIGVQVGVDLKKMRGRLKRDRIGRLICSHLA